MKKLISALLITALLTSCSSTKESTNTTFKDARDSHTTVLTKEVQDGYETPIPPNGVGLELVKYPSEVGELDAYISQNPNDNQKHPLVIWVIGGWGNSISEFLWQSNTWDDDQSGTILREKGILTMYPSYRGGNTNPGYEETLYGEINDIFSAYEYALTLDYVDPERIYLVGHSTGATRALLASEFQEAFRAIFAFGPVDEISSHNQSQFTFDLNNEEEAKLRSPIHWLQDIKTPTFIIEGEDGNSSQIKSLEQKDKNDFTEYYIIEGADHWSYLAPTTLLIADEILKDTGSETSISITDEKLAEYANGEPFIYYPPLTKTKIADTSLNIDIPAYWDFDYTSDTYVYYDTSDFSTENFWNQTMTLVSIYKKDSVEGSADEIYKSYFSKDYENLKTETINGIEVHSGTVESTDGYIKTALFNDNDNIYEVSFYSASVDDLDFAKELIDKMYQSISFTK